jgi:hypothetical protein
MITPLDQREEKILLKLRELPENKMAEVLDFVDFLRTRIVSRREKEGEEYSYYLATLRKKIQDRGGLALGKTQEKRLKKLRRTRESVWKEDYENHFRHQ